MIFWLIMGLCSFVMIAIGLFAYRREEPMWFWAGSDEEFAKEDFVDVKAYNHKNGIMWMVYGITILIPSIITYVFHLSRYVFLFLEIGVIFGGFIIMILYYERIHDKYSSK